MHPYQILSALLQTLVVWSLRRKMLFREYPAFFAYCVFDVVSSILALVLRHTSQLLYFYCSWTAAIINSILLIVVIQSLLQLPLRRLGSISRFCNALFYGLGLAATALTFWAASGNRAPEEADLIRNLVAIDNGLRFIQAALLIFVIVLALRFSLQWQPLAKYILAGIAVMVVGELMVTSIRAIFGAHANWFGRFFRPTAYLAGVCIWFYFICVARMRTSELQLTPLRKFRASLEEATR